MKFLIAAGVIGALAAPLPAFAAPAQVGNWLKGCQTGQTSKSLKGGQWACYTPAAGADDESASPILDTTQCENIDIWMADDYSAAAAERINRYSFFLLLSTIFYFKSSKKDI